MAGIDGAGRSRGVAQTSDLDQTRKGDAAERKGKQRPFAALQNRRGSVEKAVHAREKDAGFKGKIDKDFRSKADGLLRSMKAKSGGKEGAQATARQTTTSQATMRQAAATPAPPKPQRTPQHAAPERAASPAAAMASQKPPKPPRSEASQTLGRTGAKAAPTKPDRSEASKTSATLPRPQTKPRTVFGAAAEAKAQPTPAPRTGAGIGIGVGGEKPIPKTRTLLPQQGQAQTGTTKVTAQGSYDVLTNASSDQRKGIRYPTMKGAEAGGERGGQAAERAPPRLRQRPIEGGQFIKGGGFNPAKTLNNPQAGQTLRGLEASVRTPAPPRLSIGTRIMNSLKAFFRIGTPVPRPAALSQQGRLYSQLTEERMEDLLIRKPELNANKQLSFETAEREVNRNLRSITRNVADGDYTSQAKQNVGNAMQRIEALFVEYETIEEALGTRDDG